MSAVTASDQNLIDSPSMPHTAATAASLRVAILPAFDRGCGLAPRDWQVAGPVNGGREAAIFRARCAADGSDVAVKVYRQGFDAPARVQLRFTAHSAAHGRMQALSSLTVPRPLALLTEHAAIVMEWITEPSLERPLLWRQLARGERDDLIRAAGRWLRQYHDGASFGRRPMRPARELAILVERLQRRNGVSGIAEFGADFLALYKALEAASPKIENELVTIATQHGDYTPKNVLHGPMRTVGIDIHGAGRGHVLHDICRFLLRLEADAIRASPRSAVGPLGVHPLDCAAFLSGYLRPGESLPDRAFLFSQLLALLIRWAALTRPGQGPVDYAIRPIRIRRLRHMGRIVAQRLAEA